MKDYRTWWRLGCDVKAEFNLSGLIHLSKLRLISDDSLDEIDCIYEQLWAIREGLA